MPVYQSPACKSSAFLQACALPPDVRLMPMAIYVLIDEVGILYGGLVKRSRIRRVMTE
jgi:hypothetical protein